MLVWSDHGPDNVLLKGEEALNTRFDADARAASLADAAQSVGLLQRLAERFSMSRASSKRRAT
jgi:hypothetical protein